MPEFDKNLRQLAHEADVLIYDAQYSPEQLASTRKGWGHSSWLEGVKIAREAKVRNLVLFHHDPGFLGQAVDGFLSAARQEFPATWAASEGMSITLSERGVNVTMRESRHGPAPAPALRRHRHRSNRGWLSLRGKGHGPRPQLAGRLSCAESRPRLQSELRVVIEAADEQKRSSILSLRATVVHCEPGREKDQNGVGVVFIEDADPGRPRD